MTSRTPVVVLITSLFALGCSAATESENAEGEAAEAPLLAGPRLSQSEVVRLLGEAGFAEQSLGKMVCTAKWESSFYTGAKNLNTNGTTDWGLFQINDRYWLVPCGVTRQQLLDPETNVRCAKVVLDQQGIGAWYGYKAHKAECDAFRVAAPSGTASSSDDGAGQGGCWSATLRTHVAEDACVQSASSRTWFQCIGGKWYAGVADGKGPDGACTESHPLE